MKIRLAGGSATTCLYSLNNLDGSPLDPSEGALELTHGSACIIGGNLGCLIV